MLVNENSFFWSDWHPQFAAFSLVLCILARFAGKQEKVSCLNRLILVVYGLTYIVNMFTNGVRYISLKEQVIMVSFC